MGSIPQGFSNFHVETSFFCQNFEGVAIPLIYYFILTLKWNTVYYIPIDREFDGLQNDTKLWGFIHQRKNFCRHNHSTYHKILYIL